jgi:site-specific DNA recombinase
VLGAVTSILGNPRYTGRQVWNRQRTDTELADPADIALGYRQVQRWNLPDGWVISARPAHPALVSEADFIAAQAVHAARGPVPGNDPGAPEGRRRYLLAGLLTCGTCGRRMESAWSNGKPAYRCRHGHTSAVRPDPARPKNAYVREDKILAQLAALHSLLTCPRQPGAGAAARGTRRTRRGTEINAPANAGDIIGYLREHRVALTWDQAAVTLRTEPDNQRADMRTAATGVRPLVIGDPARRVTVPSSRTVISATHRLARDICRSVQLTAPG